MKILLSPEHRRAIEAHGESAYPNEGAGFLFGRVRGDEVIIQEVRPVGNKREAEAQFNRYELGPHDFAQAELDAARLGVDVIGVFHSHPDHPARPSQFDLDHALPNFAYLITSIEKGVAVETQAWHLQPDRTAFDEDQLERSALVSQPKSDL